MRREKIQIDASSIYEAERAILAGFDPSEILLTSQELSPDLKTWVEKGIQYNACSLHQLREFGKKFPSREVSIRINPGLGSGATKKTDVGGTNSSFGIWHESIPEVIEIAKEYKLTVVRVHTHIGSGSDPEVWKAVAKYTLEYAEIFKEAKIVNLGGGYKVGRMEDEKSTDLLKIGAPVKELFIEFEKKHNRKLHLEIEPGTFLIANSGSIITQIMDKVNTGSKGYTFYKLNTGMDMNTRPSLYGARHPLITVPNQSSSNKDTESVVIVGHCCETGDLFTQTMGGDLETRLVAQGEIGDWVVMEGTGAYCSSMSTKNYNSYPEAQEVLLQKDGTFSLIRKKQTLAQILENEI
jgi:diaminopimelate decarboxylase